MPAPKQGGRSQGKRPGDATGRVLEKLEADKVKNEEDRQSQLTMANQAEEEHLRNTMMDWSDPKNPKEINLTDEAVEEIYADAVDADSAVLTEEGSLEAAPRMETIQVYEDIKFIYGYGNEYDLKAGRQEKVPVYIADHLAEKGWLAFRSTPR